MMIYALNILFLSSDDVISFDVLFNFFLSQKMVDLYNFYAIL